LAPYTLPATIKLIENSPESSRVSPKPVTAVTAMGLTPKSPLTVEPDVVDTPASDKIAKLAALRSKTRSKTANGVALGEALDDIDGIVLGKPDGPVFGEALVASLLVKVGLVLGETLGESLSVMDGLALGDTIEGGAMSTTRGYIRW